MSEICSICSSQSSGLTPLLNSDGNSVETGLSEMIKICQSCSDISELQLSFNKRIKLEYQSTSQTAAPKLTLIINDIQTMISTEDLRSIFSKYGTVTHIYLCFHSMICGTEDFARITFSHERESLSALEASKCGELKLNGQSVAITAVSNFDTPIDILTDDCLRQIFLLIPLEERLKLEEVCERWKQVAPFAWSNVTKLDLKSLNEISPMERFNFLVRCGKILTQLTIDLAENDPELLQYVKKFCTNLENVEIALGYDVSSQEFVPCLKDIFIQNQKIRRIRLLDIDDNVELDFLNNLPDEIIEIHLWCEFCPLGLTVNSTLDLSKFKKLRVLSLENISLEDENNFKGIEFLNQLNYLRVSDCVIHRNDFEKIRNLRNLEALEIPEGNISDAVLFEIVNNNQCLKYLDISDLSHVSDRTFQRIVQLPQLQTLNIKNLFGLSTFHLIQLHQIKILNCKDCLSISDWDLMPLIENARKLEKINVAGCSVTMQLIASAEESMKNQHEDRRLCIQVSNPELIENWKELQDRSGKLILSDFYFGVESCFSWEESWITIRKY